VLKRLVKYTAISVLCVVILFAGLLAFSYFFPPTYEAETHLPGTNSSVAVQLEPMHLYLAEYRRKLVLRRPGMPDMYVDLFPDTGGYVRTQLYRLSDGRFLIRGFFDAVVVDSEKHTLTEQSGIPTNVGSYLGAFDEIPRDQWRFISAAKSPEQSLKAEGG
jgi:hypothetical protein